MNTPNHISVEKYLQAVDQNVGNSKLKPMSGQVHVQLAPTVLTRGSLILPGKPKALGSSKLWCRFGTVLKCGLGVDVLFPGDVVFFSHMIGVRFRGYDNPLGLSDADSTDVEFRIFRVSPKYSEIWGVWEPSFEGMEVEFRAAEASDWETATIVEESYLYGGYMLAESESRGEFWMPYSWLKDDGYHG